MAVTASVYNHSTQLVFDQAVTKAQLRLMKLNSSGVFNAAHTSMTSVANGRSATVTITSASPGVVTDTGHGYSNDQPVTLRTSGALWTGLSPNTVYYARNVTANTYELSATPGGASINTSGSQSGVHTAYSNGAHEVHGNGWSPFGEPVANVVSSTITTNDAKLAGDQTAKTATGGSITARNIVLFDFASMKPLIHYDLGQDETAGATTEFKVTFDLTGTPGTIATLSV